MSIYKLKRYVAVSLVFGLLIAAPYSYACVGARAMGMGGAFIAVSDDASATYWNPAGLTQLKVPELTYTPTLYNRDEFNYDDFVSITTPLRVGDRNWGAAAFSFINTGHVSPIVKTTDRWYWLSYGVNVSDNVSLGANLRKQDFKMELPGLRLSDRDSIVAVDLGLLWKLNKFSFGVLLQNANAPEIELFGVKNKYIRNLRAGIAFRPDNKTVIALDVYDVTGETNNTATDVSQDLRIGVERWVTDNFALRAGLYHPNSSTKEMKAVTFGASFKAFAAAKDGFFSGGQLDYGLIYWTNTPAGVSNVTHQVGLTFRF
jgi:hypothetical protein